MEPSKYNKQSELHLYFILTVRYRQTESTHQDFSHEKTLFKFQFIELHNEMIDHAFFRIHGYGWTYCELIVWQAASSKTGITNLSLMHMTCSENMIT